MLQANTLQLMNLAVVPLLAFGLFGSSVRAVLLAAGSMTLCGVFVGFTFTPMREVLNASFAEIKVLLRYGVQRLVGDFALTALMTLPVTILVHLRGVEETGFVSFGITVLSLIGSAFSPVGLILLPKASRMFAEGARADLRAHVAGIMKATVVLALIMNLVGSFCGTTHRDLSRASISRSDLLCSAVCLRGTTVCHVLRIAGISRRLLCERSERNQYAYRTGCFPDMHADALGCSRHAVHTYRFAGCSLRARRAHSLGSLQDSLSFHANRHH